MLIEGIILGFIAWLSMIISWHNSPSFIKKLTMKFSMLTDLIGSALAYLFISSVSKSIIAVVGAIVAGLLISTSVVIGKEYYKKK